MESNEILEDMEMIEEEIVADEITESDEDVLEEFLPTPEDEDDYTSPGFDYNLLYDATYNAVNDALLAQVVTDGQKISNDALSYFEGVLYNQPPFVDYVAYVGESYQYWWNNTQHTAYEYCLAYGDLELSGTTFTGTADIVKFRSSGENTISYVNDQAITLNAPMYYSRSNLGNYSGIIPKDYSGLGILLTLLLGGAIWLVKSFLVSKS